MKKKIIFILGWIAAAVMMLVYFDSRKHWANYAEQRYRDGYKEADETLTEESRKKLVTLLSCA